MSTTRSIKIWTTAYFLSRCGFKAVGKNATHPPKVLNVDSWSEAYELFFSALAESRSLNAFKNTLKNARDLYDGHTQSGRAGWRNDTPEREPQPLGSLAEQVLIKWGQRSDRDLESEVSSYIRSIETNTPNDFDSNLPNRTETTVYRILRDTELARRIKMVHRYKCQICGLTIPLPGGTFYAEAHHIQPLGSPHNGPDTEENILCLCPNHHAELDYGARKIDLEKLRVSPKHAINSKFSKYHNEEIYKSPNKS